MVQRAPATRLCLIALPGSPKPTRDRYSFRVTILLICEHSNGAVAVSRVRSRSLILSPECQFSKISWLERLLETESPNAGYTIDAFKFWKKLVSWPSQTSEPAA